MNEFNAGADSQAAYAAMPNQGLAQQGLTDEQKAKIAQMLSSAGSGLSTMSAKSASASIQPQARALPSQNQTQTLNGGQFIGVLGGR